MKIMIRMIGESGKKRTRLLVFYKTQIFIVFIARLFMIVKDDSLSRNAIKFFHVAAFLYLPHNGFDHLIIFYVDGQLFTFNHFWILCKTNKTLDLVREHNKILESVKLDI